MYKFHHYTYFITYAKKRNSVTVPETEKASINSSSVAVSLR